MGQTGAISTAQERQNHSSDEGAGRPAEGRLHHHRAGLEAGDRRADDLPVLREVREGAGRAALARQQLLPRPQGKGRCVRGVLRYRHLGCK